MSDPIVNLRHNIAWMIARQKLTLAQVAEQMGRHRSYLTHFLRHGKILIELRSVAEIAEILGVEVYQLFQDPEHHAQNPINRFLPFTPGPRTKEVGPRNLPGHGPRRDRGTLSRLPPATPAEIAKLNRGREQLRLARERRRKKKRV